MRTPELVRFAGGHIEMSAGHPHHLTVGAVERCDKCMETFWSRQDRLNVIDRMEGRTR